MVHLSALSLLLVLDFRAHMGRSYALPKQVLAACPGLKDSVEQLRAASRGRSLKVYRREKECESKMARLHPKRLRHLFKLEPLFLGLSAAATTFFSYGAWRAYVS